jgi:hypothetical protein
MNLRNVRRKRILPSFLVAGVLMAISVRIFGGDDPKPTQPKQASFLDGRRVSWSMGRDLIMQPAQNEGPVNVLVRIYVEVDGNQSSDWTRVFSYTEITK